MLGPTPIYTHRSLKQAIPLTISLLNFFYAYFSTRTILPIIIYNKLEKSVNLPILNLVAKLLG